MYVSRVVAASHWLAMVEPAKVDEPGQPHGEQRNKMCGSYVTRFRKMRGGSLERELE